MAVQNHYKKRYTKKIVSKSFYKKFDQESKTDFFSIFFLSRFWAFLDEGSSKTRLKKKIEKINLTLVLFCTLTHPPTTGVPDFFFCRPLAKKSRMVGGWVWDLANARVGPSICFWPAPRARAHPPTHQLLRAEGWG
jgi:hypothetical protein